MNVKRIAASDIRAELYPPEFGTISSFRLPPQFSQNLYLDGKPQNCCVLLCICLSQKFQKPILSGNMLNIPLNGFSLEIRVSINTPLPSTDFIRTLCTLFTETSYKDALCALVGKHELGEKFRVGYKLPQGLNLMNSKLRHLSPFSERYYDTKLACAAMTKRLEFCVGRWRTTFKDQPEPPLFTAMLGIDFAAVTFIYEVEEELCTVIDTHLKAPPHQPDKPHGSIMSITSSQFLAKFAEYIVRYSAGIKPVVNRWHPLEITMDVLLSPSIVSRYESIADEDFEVSFKHHPSGGEVKKR